MKRPGEIGTLMCCWWAFKVMKVLWKMVWYFFKKINRMTIGPSNSKYRYKPQRDSKS